MTLEFGSARENMVENQVRTNDVTDLRVQDAMRAIRRESVVPPDRAYLAYAEGSVEYSPGLCLLQPRDVAKLLQGVRPQPGERALAIAAPYGALALSEIGLKVRLRLPPGADTALLAPAMAEAGVDVVEAELSAIDPDAPYDVILVEGSVVQTPESWTAMLALGGRLGVIEQEGPVGRAKLFLHGDDHRISSRILFDAAAPALPGFQPAPAFQF